MNTPWDNVSYFEDLIAEYAGSKYAVAVDSCTNALFLSAQFCKQNNNTVNHVRVPSKTYISVPMQMIHCGYNLQFHDDCWSGLYNLDPLPIVDSAQRFTHNMYKSDTLHCVSFHSKKILSIGRGGMILTDDESAKKWLTAARYDGRSSLYYNDITSQTVPCIGWHMYMTPGQAIRGVEQFYKTPKHNKDSGKSDDYSVDLSILECFKPYTVI